MATRKLGWLIVLLSMFLVDLAFSATTEFPFIEDFESQSPGFDIVSGSGWGIAGTHCTWLTYQGTYHLDNNVSGEYQAACSDQIGDMRAVMNDHVVIPATSESPSLNYFYNLLLLKDGDRIYVDIHYMTIVDGQTVETIDRVKSYTRNQNTSGYYTWESISLTAYKGKEIWVSFAQKNELYGPGRVFVVDNFRISQPSSIDTDNDGIPDDVDLIPEGDILPAPESFIVEDTDQVEVVLSWNLLDSSYPVAGYKLYRRKEGSIVEIPLNITSLIPPATDMYVDTLVDDMTGYYYRLAAVSCEGVEGQSATLENGMAFVGNNMAQYPLEESFDSVSSSILTVDGEGWSVADSHGEWGSFSGTSHLDSNSGEVELEYHIFNQNDQRALMEKMIHIPEEADQPRLSYWYKMNLGGLLDSFFEQSCFWEEGADRDFLVNAMVSERIYIDVHYIEHTLLRGDIERVDSEVVTFKPSENTDVFVWESIPLDNYKGTEIKIVFRQEIGIGGTDGVFILDDLRISDLPYDNDSNGIPDNYESPMNQDMLPYLRNFTASSTDAGPVNLAWASLNTDDYAVTGYRVYRKITGSEDDPEIVTPSLIPPASSNWTDETIQNNMSYDYYMVAVSTDDIEGYPTEVETAIVSVALPVIVEQPQNKSVPEFTTVQFTFLANGAGLKYQWQMINEDNTDFENIDTNDTNLSAIDNTFTITKVPYEYRDKLFRCIVSNLAGEVPSNPASLHVTRAAPTILSQPVSQTVTERGPASFSIEVKGTNLNYQWMHETLNPTTNEPEYNNIEGATSETYTINSTPYSYNQTNFKCVVSNFDENSEGGTIESEPATLTVNLARPMFNEGESQPQPGRLDVYEEEPATFTLSAVGSLLSYQWLKDGVPIDGSDATKFPTGVNSNVLTISSTLHSDHGAYTCVVSNTAGSITSDAAHLIVVIETQPSLTIDGAGNQVVSKPFFNGTGVLSLANEELASLVATSDRFEGQVFNVSYQQTGAIALTVPLTVGDNVITVTAVFTSGSMLQASVSVAFTLTKIPSIVITSPEHQSTVLASEVNLNGLVYSELAPEEIRLIYNDTVLFPTGQEGTYSFDFGEVSLEEGYNTLTVKAETAYGTVAEQSVVYYTATPEEIVEIPPEIEVYSPLPGKPLTDSDVREDGGQTFVNVKGFVRGATDIARVTVNELDLTRKTEATEDQETNIITGEGTTVSFEASIQIPEGATVQNINIEAEDQNGLIDIVDYSVLIDTAAPVIWFPSFGETEGSAPVTNHQVSSAPFELAGVVRETNLGAFTINGQSVLVSPGEGDLNLFKVSIDLTREPPENQIVVEARDLSGYRTSRELTLIYDAQYDVDIITPADNSEIQFSGSTCNVDVYARVQDLADTDILTARIDEQTPVILTRSGITGSGTVTATVTGGEHTLTVTAMDDSNIFLAERTVRLTLVDSETIPVEVTSITPADKATGVEANQFITITFNREIDPALLDVKVFETAHTKVYVEPESGADLTELNNIQMVEIHKEHDVVNGGLSFFPENTLVVFYPEKDLAYNGQVFVDVSYNNEPILRTEFSVRPLPTLIEGFVTDQSLQPMEGIEVEIKELNRKTTTNADGAFSFGFGEDVSLNIPGGLYTIIANKGFKNRNYGQIQRKENIKEGLLNIIKHLRVHSLNLKMPFSRIESGQAEAKLNEGNIILKLDDTDLLFPDNRDKGDVHVQRVGTAGIPFPSLTMATPLWAYAFQPSGIEVSRNLKMVIHLPSFMGAYDYLESMGTRVVLVGLNPDVNKIIPMGVGLVETDTKTITSQGISEFKCLDYIGFSVVPSELQPILEEVANGEATMTDVIGMMESLN